jgi:hypothetical protein
MVIAFLLLAFAGGGVLAQEKPLVAESGLELTGHFVRDGGHPITKWLNQQDAGTLTFGSFGSPQGKDEYTGTLTTAPFRAPAHIQFFLSGFPNKPGIRMFLRAEDNPALVLNLKTRLEPCFYWRLRSWRLPEEWHGKIVRLVVDDESKDDRGWVAVSLPKEGDLSYLKSAGRALRHSASMVWAVFLLLAPGIAIALSLSPRLKLEGHNFLIVVLAGTALCGYLCFWAYLRAAFDGRVASFGFVGAGLIGIAFHLFFRTSALRHLRDREVVYPFTAALLLSVMFAGAGAMYIADDSLGLLSQVRFFESSMPPDNVLPEIVEDKLYEGTPLRPAIFSDWQSSDRPPLQSGIALMERPFWPGPSSDLEYTLVSIFLQSTWVIAVWVLLRRIGFQIRSIVPVAGFCAFSGFCFFHSTYVWPKLLAASFCMLAISYFFPLPSSQNRRTAWTRLDAVLAALCVGLALLSHTGCGLTLLACPLLLLRPRREFSWQAAVPGVLVLLALMVPWTLYQKLYDPPGDQLLKLSLTGAMNKTTPLGAAFIKAYNSISVWEFLYRRVENVESLFEQGRGVYSNPSWATVRSFVIQDFFASVHAIGLLNIGLLLRLLLKRKIFASSPFQAVDRLVLMTAASLAVWVTVMYSEHSTVIHQGSLASVLLLMAAFALYIAAVFPRGIYLLLALQVGVIFPIFVFSKPIIEAQAGVLWDGGVDSGMLTVFLLSAVALLGLGYFLVIPRAQIAHKLEMGRPLPDPLELGFQRQGRS